MEIKADGFLNEGYEDSALKREHIANLGGYLVYSELFFELFYRLRF